MKPKVLIISPYFAPSNAADSQRIRMSLPYFDQYGWEAEVVTVKSEYSDMQKDELLLQSIPQQIKVHHVAAFRKKWTSKIGLGSIALRSLWFYFMAVNRLLKAQDFALIYFSTTQFPVCILGAYWKKRFQVPYVIDMQDPWHSDYYRDKPKAQRPAKYWFSYRLNKYLEPLAMNSVGGLISVSAAYLHTLRTRYPRLNRLPSSTITFGVLKDDFDTAIRHQHAFVNLLKPEKINIVYIGRGGEDMHTAITPVFQAMQKGLHVAPLAFSKLHFYFIGTSYAPAGQGKATILPLAEQYQLRSQVTEYPDRISFYHALLTMQQADALFIPGSDDPHYTASKIYQSLLVEKPLMTIFHQRSSIAKIVERCSSNAVVLRFSDPDLLDRVEQTLTDWSKRVLVPVALHASIAEHTAENSTRMQVQLFNQVISNT